jgi:hypothetical protein
MAGLVGAVATGLHRVRLADDRHASDRTFRHVSTRARKSWLVIILAFALLIVAAAIVVAMAVLLTGGPRWAVPHYMRGQRRKR